MIRWILLFAGMACAADRQVAITIDDLPRGGDGGERSVEVLRSMTERLLKPFRDEKIPLIGFVNEGKLDPKDMRVILDLWLDAGADLGNHTYSHANLNTVELAEYEADVVKGEPVTRAALAARGKKLEFFRHPYLFAGPTIEKKRGLAEFLTEHGYRVAPVTLDNADYSFAAAFLKPGLAERVKREYVPYLESVVAFFEERSVEVAGREFPQVLLLHANELNAQMMPQILAMFRKRGYEFVSLDQALRDDAYRMPEAYVGKGGFSWIHRWSRIKGMPNKGEPDEPKWLTAP